MINSKTKIDIPATSTEGIIFGDLFINNEDLFISIFEKYYQQNATQIINAANELNKILQNYELKAINSKIANDFKIAWDKFQKIVLFNQQDLQLIVAYRDETQSGRLASISGVLKQKSVEESTATGYGINTGNQLITDSMEAIKANKIEQFFQSHINGFLNQLSEKKHAIDDNGAAILWQYHRQHLNDKWEYKDQLKGLRWYEAFYTQSTYFTGQGLGQAYDAYMNHMANYERQFFDYLKSGGKNSNSILISDIKRKPHSVFKEEGGLTPVSGFPKLLGDSKNHTGWYTGGDIVIINPKTMGVVYNIQLKTTTTKNKTVFPERIKNIKKFINNFISLKEPKDMAKKLFEFLKTSISNRNEFKALPQETINSIIMDSFKQFT